MFIDREQELAFLNSLLQRQHPGPAQLVLLYGRRRVGKTSLLLHWMQPSGLPAPTGRPRRRQRCCHLPPPHRPRRYHRKRLGHWLSRSLLTATSLADNHAPMFEHDQPIGHAPHTSVVRDHNQGVALSM